MVHVSTPQWDLPLVLEALVTESFEPIIENIIVAVFAQLHRPTHQTDNKEHIPMEHDF